MTDHPNNPPLHPDEDQALDQALASLGLFSPSPGFGDRVMARVRVTAPAPTPALTAAPAPARRVRRWPALLAPLSGVAALTSTALTALVALNWGAITGWAATAAVSAAVPAWHALLGWLAAASASSGSTLLAAGFTVGLAPLIWSLSIMSLAVPVSLFGLFLVARPRVRMSSHAAR